MSYRGNRKTSEKEESEEGMEVRLGQNLLLLFALVLVLRAGAALSASWETLKERMGRQMK